MKAEAWRRNKGETQQHKNTKNMEENKTPGNGSPSRIDDMDDSGADTGSFSSSISYDDDEAKRVRAAMKNKLDAMETARNRKTWRPKPKRKKNTQRKMKSYFSKKKNEDGYPLDDCEWEPNEKKHVYRPPDYKVIDDFSIGKYEHCVSCHLKPCLTRAYFSEASKLCAHRTMIDKVSSRGARHEVVAMWKEKYRKHMKVNKSHATVTKCMTEVANHHFPDSSSDEESSGSSDEELFDESDPSVLSKLFGDPVIAVPNTSTEVGRWTVHGAVSCVIVVFY